MKRLGPRVHEFFRENFRCLDNKEEINKERYNENLDREIKRYEDKETERS